MRLREHAYKDSKSSSEFHTSWSGRSTSSSVCDSLFLLARLAIIMMVLVRPIDERGKGTCQSSCKIGRLMTRRGCASEQGALVQLLQSIPAASELQQMQIAPSIRRRDVIRKAKTEETARGRIVRRRGPESTTKSMGRACSLLRRWQPSGFRPRSIERSSGFFRLSLLGQNSGKHTSTRKRKRGPLGQSLRAE